jgi:hypothetical protein
MAQGTLRLRGTCSRLAVKRTDNKCSDVRVYKSKDGGFTKGEFIREEGKKGGRKR